MKNFSTVALTVGAAAALVSGVVSAQGNKPKTVREQLIGSWHLVKTDAPTVDGKPQPPTPLGLIVFTADGQQAVQLMYPVEAGAMNNQFLHDGYEASFGTFEVDETKQQLRYKPVAANTRDAFIGTTELLHPTFPDPTHFVMHPADPGQHWSVTWEKLAGGTADRVQSGEAEAGPDGKHLVGTWHLVAIDSPTTDGSPQPPKPMGLTVYTSDGYEAVQLMYPKEAGLLNNEFVHDGYEASYGTYSIDESKHLLTHRVKAANTREKLVGTEEKRIYSFPDATHLVMRPADPSEHWSVTWEKD